MAKPRKGVVPPQFQKTVKNKQATGQKKSTMPGFLKKKLGRKKG